MIRGRLWPQAVAVLFTAALYVTLPQALVFGTAWERVGVPVVELALIALLTVPGGHRQLIERGMRRRLSIALIAVIGAANALSLGYLIHQLLYGGGVNGRQLLYAAFDIWLTNVIVFGLWYWELDGGGPVRRAERAPKKNRDFAFIQQTDPEVRADGWHSTFVDYLYVSFTNASAFSPTDTMPLTHRAKMLMLLQSVVSIVTLLLVAARAVNILNT